MVAVNFDREEILRTWSIFRQSGETLELRVPKAAKFKTISGYFDDPSKFVDTVIGLADENFTGIYFTVNPVNLDLLARASNRCVKYAQTTTTDADIVALHWLPIDIDAKRPAGISSTDLEHEAAITKAKEMRSWLIEELGWPAGAFVLGDSGNGAHTNVKIDLPNLPENVALVKDCLEALDFLFSDDMVEVDVTSQNPSRIWKLYGTAARKGDSTADRPHRLARLLEVPETPETVTREKLKTLAAMLPAQEELPKSANGRGQGFDPVAYCQDHGLQVHHTKTYQGSTLAVLENCVFDSTHTLSACIIGWPSGARTYRCRHHSCLDKHWSGARAIIESKEAKRQGGPDMVDSDGAGAGSGETFPALTIDDLCETHIVHEGQENERTEYKFSPDKACDAILERFHIVSTTDETIYVYNAGYYSPDGWDEILRLIHSTAGDNFNKHFHAELEEKIHYATLARNPFNKNPYLFPAKDGIIDLKTGEVREHSPDDCLTFIYNAQCHHPNPDYGPFLWYLASTFPDIRDCLTVIDIITSIGIRIPFDVFVFLIGGGENGKGILEKLILAMYTIDRGSAVKIQEVSRSHFASGALFTKTSGVPTSEVETIKDAMSVIKGVSTGEPPDSDVKYGARVKGMPHLLPHH